VSLLVVEW